MALPLRAQEQGACQGSLSPSSPSAPALAKFTPAAERSGVVFHAWLDAIRTPPRAHLVIENTNPYDVAVRFEAELRGGSGPLATGPRCVWIRARELAPETVFDYRGATLSQVRIGAAEVAPLERPAPDAVAAPPAPARPARVRPPPARPRADTPRAGTAAPARRREAAPKTVQVTAPLKMVQADTVAEARARVPPGPAKVENGLPEAVRAGPSPRATARPPPPIRQKPPPLARAANRTMRVAAAVILVPAGFILGIAVASAVTLLGGIVPLGMLRRRELERNVAEARR